MYINIHSMRILERINRLFGNKPAQKRVVMTLLRYGISVRGGELYLGNIRIPFMSIARVLGIDRRVVMATVENIAGDEELRRFFEELEPAGPFLSRVARRMGCRCLTIVPTEDRPGIIAGVTSILAKHGINILQVIAEDPRIYEDQKLHIIVEGEVPGEALNEIMKLEFVKTIQIE